MTEYRPIQTISAVICQITKVNQVQKTMVIDDNDNGHNAGKKRKQKDWKDDQNGKKARESKLKEKESNTSESKGKPDRKGKVTRILLSSSRADSVYGNSFHKEGKDIEKDKSLVQYDRNSLSERNTDDKISLRRDSVVGQNCIASNSSSSMISRSSKIKINLQEVTGSPLGSVCSSSFRKCLNGSDRRENQSKYERNEDPQKKMDTFCWKDRKSTSTQFMLQNHDGEGSSNWLPSGRTDQVEVIAGRGKSLNSPRFRYSQSVPDSGEGGDYDVLPVDGSGLAANNALKEAKDLKHFADHFKMSQSGLESTKLFFQATLKFLHGASLLDPCNSDSANYGDMTPTKQYTTTAKLFENCACEYERCNDMASAALAYKCMEVAYMRVIYSNAVIARRDQNELQMGLQMASPVASPSSSASVVDIDATVQKMDIDVGFPHPTGNHVAAARNQTNFVRLLDYTQGINFAMEASRKSKIAFAAANILLAEKGNMEAISFVKKVLDFSFHDLDGLLRLVHLAMEAINW